MHKSRRRNLSLSTHPHFLSLSRSALTQRRQKKKNASAQKIPSLLLKRHAQYNKYFREPSERALALLQICIKGNRRTGRGDRSLLFVHKNARDVTLFLWARPERGSEPVSAFITSIGLWLIRARINYASGRRLPPRPDGNWHQLGSLLSPSWTARQPWKNSFFASQSKCKLLQWPALSWSWEQKSLLISPF